MMSKVAVIVVGLQMIISSSNINDTCIVCDSIHLHTYIYIYVYIYACLYVYIYICVCVYMYIYISAGPLVGHMAVEGDFGSKYQVYKFKYRV